MRFFFNAYGILKLIFKKKDGIFVGRFDEKYTVFAKNPVTNKVSPLLTFFMKVIIGEVEFYIIKNPRVEFI